jgi:hypothetical protein
MTNFYDQAQISSLSAIYHPLHIELQYTWTNDTPYVLYVWNYINNRASQMMRAVVPDASMKKMDTQIAFVCFMGNGVANVRQGRSPLKPSIDDPSPFVLFESRASRVDAGQQLNGRIVLPLPLQEWHSYRPPFSLEVLKALEQSPFDASIYQPPPTEPVEVSALQVEIECIAAQHARVSPKEDPDDLYQFVDTGHRILSRRIIQLERPVQLLRRLTDFKRWA